MAMMVQATAEHQDLQATMAAELQAQMQVRICQAVAV
jgi:hypothetical protein